MLEFALTLQESISIRHCVNAAFSHHWSFLSHEIIVIYHEAFAPSWLSDSRVDHASSSLLAVLHVRHCEPQSCHDMKNVIWDLTHTICFACCSVSDICSNRYSLERCFYFLIFNSNDGCIVLNIYSDYIMKSSSSLLDRNAIFVLTY